MSHLLSEIEDWEYAGSIKRQRKNRTPSLDKKRRISTKDQAKQECMLRWKLGIKNTYPDNQKRTYLKPPVRFNRVTFTTESIGGEEVKIVRAGTQLSDSREDESLQRVHNVLAHLFGRQDPPEGAFVIFELDFDNYLNFEVEPKDRGGSHLSSIRLSGSTGSSLYRQSTSSAQSYGRTDVDLSVFRRPRNLDSGLQRGSFDVLIVHRDIGIIDLKVKAIGDVFGVVGHLQSVTSQHDAIRKKLRRTLNQLDKEQKVLRELFDDLTEGTLLPVVKGLVFTNLERQTFAMALRAEPQLFSMFVNCLEESTLENGLHKCIFSDQLPPIGRSVDVTEDIIRRLYHGWWAHISRARSAAPLKPEVYESIIARLGGPATTQFVCTARDVRADVSTLNAAVLHAALCFSDPVLTSDVVEKLQTHAPHRYVFITGSPGTGKSLLLFLEAREHIKRGGKVLVVSLWHGSETASNLLYQKIANKSSARDQHLISLIHCQQGERPLEEIQNTILRSVQEVSALQGTKTGQQTGYEGIRTTDPGRTRPVAYNEISSTSAIDDDDIPTSTTSDDVQRDRSGPRQGQAPGSKVLLLFDEMPWFFVQFAGQLLEAVGKDNVIIWTASAVKHCTPDSFVTMTLTHSLRCPPVVVREMMTCPAYATFARSKYTSLDTGVISGTPCPTDGPRVQRINHRVHEPTKPKLSCWECYLCGKAVAEFLVNDLQITPTYVGNSDTTRLCFWDVLISGYVHCDNTGQMETFASMEQSSSLGPDKQATAFLKGLRDGNVDYDVITKGDKSGPKRLASPECVNKVQVAEAGSIMGLERAVVVVLGTRDVRATYPRLVDPVFDVMGRCTSQLLLVGIG